MNRIEACFESLKSDGKTAFIPYITAGDPTLERTKEIILALEKAGADVIELGIPFSDPVGDGSVIQEAMMRALESGMTPSDVLELVKSVREESQIPILLFTYYNPILAVGEENFAQRAADAGADGVLCVDLPPEEADTLKSALDKHNLCTVFLTAPTTTDDRLETVARQCTGFVYYVSRLGVTGEQAALANDLNQAVSRIKSHSDVPVAVGFGISKPEHASEVASMADGVVVGSAIVRMIGELGDTPDAATKVGDFVQSLVEATKA